MLSVCLIAGNEEHVIGRCLESIKGIADQVCVIFARGSQDPDSTLRVVRDTLGPLRLDWGIYENSQPGLPHVDDFSRARNLAFSLATCDWILWLDCDDIVPPESARAIRNAIEDIPADVNALWCSYRIANHGSVILRERLIRRGCGRWVGAVHETCQVEGKALECPEIVILHGEQDPAKKTSSARRNLAIMDRVLDQVPRNMFYRHAEHVRAGNDSEALRDGHAALAMLAPEAREERYLVHMNLAHLENSDAQLHAAVATQPHRREAFAELCQRALAKGAISDALAYFRLMDALPEPKPLPWTHDGRWYPGGWAQLDLKVRVLRACGQNEKADDVDDYARTTNAEYAAHVAKSKQDSRA